MDNGLKIIKTLKYTNFNTEADGGGSEKHTFQSGGVAFCSYNLFVMYAGELIVTVDKA